MNVFSHYLPLENIVIIFFSILEFTDHTKDEITRGETCRPITPSLNTCDMDERDWTSLESSSESSVECSADEEMMVSPKEQEF